jgi:hypothetical protein
LAFQMIWSGPVLRNSYLLVCQTCMDIPQEQSRSIVLPADPLPTRNPRPENYAVAETDQRVTAAPSITDPTTGIPIPQGTPLVTTQGYNRTTDPVGYPAGIPLASADVVFNKVQYGPTLSVVTVLGDGNYTITVNCSKSHNLSVGSTVIAAGLSSGNGAYPVASVVSATVFTYQTETTIPSGVLWGANSAVWSANVGLPLNYAGLPETGL